jgi:hypothetical protein
MPTSPLASWERQLPAGRLKAGTMPALPAPPLCMTAYEQRRMGAVLA